MVDDVAVLCGEQTALVALDERFVEPPDRPVTQDGRSRETALALLEHAEVLL